MGISALPFGVESVLIAFVVYFGCLAFGVLCGKLAGGLWIEAVKLIDRTAPYTGEGEYSLPATYGSRTGCPETRKEPCKFHYRIQIAVGWIYYITHITEIYVLNVRFPRVEPTT